MSLPEKFSFRFTKRMRGFAQVLRMKRKIVLILVRRHKNEFSPQDLAHFNSDSQFVSFVDSLTRMVRQDEEVSTREI